MPTRQTMSKELIAELAQKANSKFEQYVENSKNKTEDYAPGHDVCVDVFYAYLAENNLDRYHFEKGTAGLIREELRRLRNE